jgi:hypothetical protein
MERLNWLADTSPNGLSQAAGIMINPDFPDGRAIS